MHPIILDFEASGFGGGSYPIEVGVAMADGSTHCMLIRPEPEWTRWEMDAERIHGIRREDLLTHGVPVDVVCQRLDGWLRGQQVYSDAWGHDHTWLHQLYDAANRVPGFRLASLRQLLAEHELPYWEPARRDVMQGTQATRHRASTDARLLQCVLERVRLLATTHQPDVLAG